jgi:NAD(P)-dependent dehydrogenase (short-subunit alcohol dehydrogenase family)
MSYEEFDGKVALVTGASNGIGRATALAFAEHGAKVVVSDIDDERGEKTAAEIRESGGEAIYVHTDVSSSEEVEQLFETIDDEYDHLHYACNNAGIEGEMGATADCSLEAWEKTIGVNLDGTFYCLKQELERMVPEGEGAIVNMSSVAGFSGFPGLPAYVTSKHGVVGLTKTAALDYAESGVRVNAVCPGVIDTEMVQRTTRNDPEVEQQYIAMEPVGRMGEPEEIADSVLWLCSEKASFVTGETLAVDGGFLAR